MPGFVGATKGTTTERGYGWTQHIKPRKQAFAALPEWSPCCICGRGMWKHATETLVDGRVRSTVHRQHNRARTGYLGFAHRDCNLKDGASEGGRRMVRKRMASKRMVAQTMGTITQPAQLDARRWQQPSLQEGGTHYHPTVVRHSRVW